MLSGSEKVMKLLNNIEVSLYIQCIASLLYNDYAGIIVYIRISSILLPLVQLDYVVSHN